MHVFLKTLCWLHQARRHYKSGPKSHRKVQSFDGALYLLSSFPTGSGSAPARSFSSYRKWRDVRHWLCSAEHSWMTSATCARATASLRNTLNVTTPWSGLSKAQRVLRHWMTISLYFALLFCCSAQAWKARVPNAWGATRQRRTCLCTERLI